MQITSRKRWLVFLLVGLVSAGGGYVVAQEADPTDGELEGQGDGQGQGEDQPPKIEPMTPNEMSKAGAKLLEDMRQALKKVEQLQDAAKKEKDILKVNCVTDKLVRIKQLLLIAEESRAAIEEAIVANDEEGRYQEYEKMVIIHQQVAELVAEAEACIGEDLVYLGPTDVDVDSPDEPDDPTRPLDPEIPEVELPPAASPFV